MRELEVIWNKLDQHRGAFAFHEHYSPRVLVEFVSKLAKHLKPTTIIDPACGSGSLLAGAANVAIAKTVHGIDINEQATKVASSILGDRATVVHGDAFVPFDGMHQHYDLIVADPPLGMRLPAETASSLNLKSGSAQFADGLLVWAAARLNPSGVALIVVTPSFFFSQTSKQVQKAIQNAGCRIGAAIHMPPNTRLNTSISTYLLMIEPGEQADIFVGQLSPDPVHQDQLLANLIDRKPKGSPSLGRLCPLSDFMGYESFVSKEKLSRLARDCGWTGHAAEAVFPRHTKMRIDGKKEELSEDAESLFLKLVGKCRASTRIDELRTGKSQLLREVLHLKVDPDIADPTFMTHWFNESRIGRLSLDALRSGETIPRIRSRDLLRSRIYLPPIDQQRLVVEGAAYLRKIQAEADELKNALWSGTESAEDLVGRIHSINQEDHYEDWLETLPFPLASILWRHHASKGSYQLRYTVLLHFFEATAAFLATIHLSAFMSDDETWKKYGQSLQEKLSSQGLSLDRATFGTWKLIAEKLSSACSSIIKDPECDGLWQRIYCTTNHSVTNMLSDSKLRRVLQDANKMRNDWHGHGGAISEEQAKKIHTQLFDLVQQLRGIFSRTWQRYELIQPGDGRYQDGVHHVTCKRAVGTRTPFEERTYVSTDPLEAKKLYLFDSVDRRGLQLQPFIRVMPSPEKQATACYIFSRLIDANNARSVSFHFEQESEINHTSEGLDDTLTVLREELEPDT